MKKSFFSLLITASLSAVPQDDKPENVEAAKKWGIDAIVFESSQQIRKELKACGLL